MKEGIAIYNYVAQRSMQHRAMSNSDGDLLLVPQEGALSIRTELGELEVAPDEIAILPRGIRFSILLKDSRARGYVLEVFNGHFELPQSGVVGANSLASARDFLAPVACFEDVTVQFELVNKYMHQLFSATIDHSPFDVVAWHGNYCPYKYDLKRFCAVNTVGFDHPVRALLCVTVCCAAAGSISLSN